MLFNVSHESDQEYLAEKMCPALMVRNSDAVTEISITISAIQVNTDNATHSGANIYSKKTWTGAK